MAQIPSPHPRVGRERLLQFWWVGILLSRSNVLCLHHCYQRRAMRDLNGPLSALSVIASCPGASGASEPTTPTTPPTTPTTKASTSAMSEVLQCEDAVLESSSKHRRGSRGQVVGLNEENQPAENRQANRRSPIPVADGKSLASHQLADARVMALRSSATASYEVPEACLLGRKEWEVSTPPKIPAVSALRPPLSPRRPPSSSPLGARAFTERMDQSE